MTQSHDFLLNRLHWFQSYNSIQLISISRFRKNEFQSLFRIPLNYLVFNVPPFTFHLEDGERRFQSCSNEHDWFRAYFTWNTHRRWCPNIPGGFNYSRFPTVNCDCTGITLSYFYVEVNIICIRTYVQCQRVKLPPIFRGL